MSGRDWSGWVERVGARVVAGAVAVFAVGLGAVVASAIVDPGSWWASGLLEIGAAVMLLVPLFLIEQTLEARFNARIDVVTEQSEQAVSIASEARDTAEATSSRVARWIDGADATRIKTITADVVSASTDRVQTMVGAAIAKPSAQRVFALAQEAHKLGGYEWGDLLDLDGPFRVAAHQSGQIEVLIDRGEDETVGVRWGSTNDATVFAGSIRTRLQRLGLQEGDGQEQLRSVMVGMVAAFGDRIEKRINPDGITDQTPG